MVMTRALTAKQNQEANSRKRHNTCDNNGDSPSWSSMLDEILFKIIFHLGVVDFIAFSGVCKSWRTLARSNKKMFMLSRPPMHMSISTQANKKIHCYLEDLEGRKFKTILPRSSDRTCLGSTCGYLIMFREKTRDFKLLNLITRHELRFPCFPYNVCPDPENFRCALVFSPTMCSWGFVISMRLSMGVSVVFSSKLASWTRLQSSFPIYDLHSFQGKIYALSMGINLFEVTLGSTPALTQLKMEPLAKSELVFPEFVTLSGKLCVIGNRSEDQDGTIEVDFDQMKWLNVAKSLKEYACFARFLKCGLTKLELWTDPGKENKRSGYFYGTDLWYCPHKCLDVNLLHE